MANVKNRAKSAPEKNNKSKRKKSSTGVSEIDDDSDTVKKRVSTAPKTQEKTKTTQQNGKTKVSLRDALNKNNLMTRSGRLRKRSKDNLKLIDNILKSELMIEEIVEQNDSKKPEENGVNNNNVDYISKENETKLDASCEKKHRKYSKHTNKKGKMKKKAECQKSVDKIEKRVHKMKQVTLSNGLVLTLAVHQCDYCKRTFTCKSSLRRHIYLHLDLKPYSCTHCLKKFRQRCNLNVHIRTQHPDAFLGNYVCKKCDKAFMLKENLHLHMASHVKNENSFKCVHCDKQFSHHLLLMQHEKRHLSADERWKCAICNTHYDCRSRLALHIKSHLKIKEFICQHCGKEFLRPNSIKRHIQISHGGQTIQCPICKKNLKGHLTEHMRTHEKDRPHVCPDCGQRFTQSTQLNVHRRSHTGDRPYPCRICGRPFSHSNALMLHIRRHTGEKPFQCAMCPLSFSQLPHMKAHMQKIHGKDNPYKCSKCGQFFKLKAHLDTHKKICTVGDKELSFEQKLQASIQYEEVEVESVMSLSRMRFLLALLLTMIATKDKLRCLGFNKRLIDDLLLDSLEAMGHSPCKDKSLTPLKRLKTNIAILLEGTVPKDQMEQFKNENKTTEELLELLTDEKKKE